MSDANALHNYFMLRGALLTHRQLPWQLSAEKQVALEQNVKREEQLVVRILSLPEAADIKVESAQLHQSFLSFVTSMTPCGDTDQILHQAGLHQESLLASMDVEMKAAMLLERLSETLTPSEQEVYRWFKMNPEKFLVPERREVFQILITINDAYPENSREAACQRISELALKANTMPDTFSELAMSHSECPSAVAGGYLGVVVPGHLYTDLDHELFSLKSGAISRVVESPLGFHLLRCGVIEPQRYLAWDEVRESLTKRLTEIERKRYLKNWSNRNRESSKSKLV